jgi:hypothetical protein
LHRWRLRKAIVKSIKKKRKVVRPMLPTKIDVVAAKQPARGGFWPFTNTKYGNELTPAPTNENFTSHDITLVTRSAVPFVGFSFIARRANNDDVWVVAYRFLHEQR